MKKYHFIALAVCCGFLWACHKDGPTVDQDIVSVAVVRLRPGNDGAQAQGKLQVHPPVEDGHGPEGACSAAWAGN